MKHQIYQKISRQSLSPISHSKISYNHFYFLTDVVALRLKHGGILGLSACVLAYPYVVPLWMPEILLEIGKHLHSTPQVQVSSIVSNLKLFGSISFMVCTNDGIFIFRFDFEMTCLFLPLGGCEENIIRIPPNTPR